MQVDQELAACHQDHPVADFQLGEKYKEITEINKLKLKH